MPENILHLASIWLIPILVAITFHEAAHGFVAKRFGDQTAFMLGRITLNPLRHIDPLGTVVLPAALLVMGLPALGYAKPVPVNFLRLKPYRMGVIAVAAAGPLMNLLLALASVVLMYLSIQLPLEIAQPLTEMLVASVQINVVLMVFNLLPLPPLDGGRIVSALLTGQVGYYYDRIEPYGMWIVLLLVISGLMFELIGPVIESMLTILALLTP